MEPSPFVRVGPRHKPVDQREPGVRYRGLCKPLRRAFYPSYRYVREQQHTPTEDQHTTQRRSRRTPRQGRLHGQAVDAALTEYTRAPTVAARNRVHARITPYARRAVDVLERHQYRLAHTQVGVGSEWLDGHRVCLYTAIDIACTTRIVPVPMRSESREVKGGLGAARGAGAPVWFVVEVKACESVYYERPSFVWDRVTRRTRPRTMLPPYQDQLDHPRNQHQLQLGFTLRLARATFPDLPIAGAFVLRVHAGGEQTYPLESWVLDPTRLPKALAALGKRPRVRARAAPP